MILSPVMITAAAAILLNMGRPIFFRQLRPGYKCKPFEIFKFRTMRLPSLADGKVWFRSNEERLTKLGCFLRKTSIDELPELINVLRGEMSLVGPRPLLMEYLEKYTQTETRRHEVKPGITGWAQVNGRNNLPFSKRLALDVWYVDNRSFCFDLKILLMTAINIFRTSDIVSDQNVDDVDDIGLSADRKRIGPSPEADNESRQ